MIGGSCVTGGGVVFAGEANGYFRAYNAKTGKKLWEFQTGAGANAACSLYELGGKLHVAVASGGNAQINAPRGDNLLVFTVD
jgi:glucose dehydrogenase